MRPQDPDEHAKLADAFVKQMFGQLPAHYPDGKIRDDDLGEGHLALKLDRETRTIMMIFSKPITWMGFGKQAALQFGQKMIELANELK